MTGITAFYWFMGLFVTPLIILWWVAIFGMIKNLWEMVSDE